MLGEQGLDDILLQLAERWNTIDFATQKYIATMAAGSRQQSRFIALLANYQRTLELVEISERSNGATAAQAATYMLGMEAAINKVTVAGEKLITALTDSKALIAIVDFVGE